MFADGTDVHAFNDPLCCLCKVYNGEVEAVPPLLNECIQKLINGGIFTEVQCPTVLHTTASCVVSLCTVAA